MKLREATLWLQDNLTFDVDQRVHVFEVTIRVLGGLLSCHIMLERMPSAVPGYDGALLRLATDLGNRLLPAFDTKSGIPLSWVHLRKGVMPKESRFTCTACAGTMLMEFGTLSRLTGNPVYEQKARHAVQRVFDMRDPGTGLLGNTLHTDNAEWLRKDSGIGAGIDSFYEYLLKAYLLFGDEDYLIMFAKLYTSAMHGLTLRLAAGAPAGTATPPPWLAHADMQTGKLAHPWISSLSAFWPALQALAGQVEDAQRLLGAWVQAWGQMGGLPELFDMAAQERHPLQKGYPLRPELMESTYFLHSVTQDPALLQVGRMLQTTLVEGHKQKCGYAGIADMATGELEDSMESFFLSETCKYLYLLHANTTHLPNNYVFTTEGHLVPPFNASLYPPAGPNNQATAWTHPFHSASAWFMPDFSTLWMPLSDLASEGLVHSDGPLPPNIGGAVPAAIAERCASLCSSISDADMEEKQRVLQAALPLVPLAAQDAVILRQRRCTACLHVTSSMEHMFHPGTESPDFDTSSLGSWSVGSVQTQGTPDKRQLLCLLEVRDDRLQCGQLHQITHSAGLDVLPDNAVILESLPMTSQPEGALYTLTLPDKAKQYDAVGASFGQDLQAAGRCGMLKGGLCELHGALAVAQPADACGPVEAAVDGAILLVTRGACTFVQKALNAAAAGAAGIIVINNVDKQTAFAMGYDQEDIAVNIIAFMVNKDVGLQLLGTVEQLEVLQQQTYINIGAQAQSAATLDITASTGPAMQEQHVVVPEATQRWIQSQKVLLESAMQGDTSGSTGGTSPIWQSLLVELATQTLQQSGSVIQDKPAQCVAPN
ncbi:hypothetical protein ABBQ32_010493 [Trebouxia sp. C0010 RCD-2024]